MSTFNDLLSTYDAYEQQKTIEITDRLARLRQQLASQLLTLRQEESKFVTAQQSCLDQLRPHLATDARALLKTPQFAAFVEFLLEQQAQDAMRSNPLLQVAPSPTFWLLNSVPIALRLHEIERIQLDTLDGVDGEGAVMRMQVTLNDWQQLVHVSTHALRQQFQGAAAIEQIRSQLPRVDANCDESAHLKLVVVQEIACLVLYVARLFSLHSLTALGTGFEL